MSELWRRKAYYRPRVLIGTESVLDPSYDGIIVCLTANELAMLRQIVQYLHRRSTFATEYEDLFYVAPSDTEWDDLQAIVADLEEKLMGGCEDIVEQLECICQSLRALAAAQGLTPDYATDDQPLYDDYISPVTPHTGDPPDGFADWSEWDTQVCKSAQKAIDDMIETMGRIYAFEGGAITVTAILIETIMAATTILPPLAIVTIIAGILALYGLQQLNNDAQLWVAANKQDLVCAIFSAESPLEARQNVHAYLDENWDVSGSPQFVKLILNDHVMGKIFDGTMPGYSVWSTTYSADYCLPCTIEEGTDWIAIPVFQEVSITWTSGGWVWDCLQGSMYGTENICAVVIECTQMGGPAIFVWSNEAGDATCTGASLTDNTSSVMSEGTTYYLYESLTHDKDEAVAAICSGATELQQLSYPQHGPGDWEVNFRAGTGTAGTCKATIKYIVYET